MAKIVRCKLPDGVHRFKPFTVEDYRDFLLIRNELNTKTSEEQQELLDELLEDYFYEYPKSWRPFIFINVYTSSIGKTRIPVVFECSECKKTKQVLFNLKTEALENPVIETAGIKIYFKYPEKTYDSNTELILDNIDSISDENGKYSWASLSEEDRLSVIDAIDLDSLEILLKKMKPFYFELKYGCCKKNISVYDNIVPIFKLLLNPDEVFTFYQVNHLLVKYHYDLNSIMNMIPIERNIALSLVEKDLK
ncbi:baseplate hub assembly catalyst [Pectobacterium bacteriophage PM2]|uniref:Baseplate hub assembly catalyst n=1 Tax=Pectobacterium bacteriophage PM2 TaxID=1429794 RepID=A0A0A0Q0U8_9CAUD|nr:baseplate hub assembly catalyst [Pectobacterium bacteriophage PM2]AHY25173.1 baseplate hub assembly catalyst [Pectobacterium bacteriophage PM2]